MIARSDDPEPLDGRWADCVIWTRVCPACGREVGFCAIGGASPYQSEADAQLFASTCPDCQVKTVLRRADGPA